jgi:hypothetical protein
MTIESPETFGKAVVCSVLLADLVRAYEREVNPVNDWTQTAMTQEDFDAATKEYRLAKEWLSANEHRIDIATGKDRTMNFPAYALV